MSIKEDLASWSMERFNAWMSVLPSTNFKIVTAVILNFFTFFWIASASAYVWWTVDETVLGMWLTFLAALNGLGYMQFAKKRDTDAGYAAVKKPDPPSVAVTTHEATVTGDPVTVTTDPSVTPPPPAVPSKQEGPVG